MANTMQIKTIIQISETYWERKLLGTDRRTTLFWGTEAHPSLYVLRDADLLTGQLESSKKDLSTYYLCSKLCNLLAAVKGRNKEENHIGNVGVHKGIPNTTASYTNCKQYH